jgi:hypothetical protein
MANTGTNIPPSSEPSWESVEQSAEWNFLRQLTSERRLEVDLQAEIENAEQDLTAFIAR